MKKLVAALLVAFPVALSASADVFEYEPGPFDKLTVRADVDVVYRNVPDSVGFIRYESAVDYSAKMDVSCDKGKLTIAERMTDEEYGPLPTLYLYSDYLVTASYEGTRTMTLDMKCATPTFSVKLVGNGKIVCNGVNTTDISANLITGNGTIVLRGKCDKAKFTLTGTGVIQADELMADDVSCKVLGTGTIGCRPLERLNVLGAGSTKIYYYGDPVVKKTGSAKLEQLPYPEGETPIEEYQGPANSTILPVNRHPESEIDVENDDF